MLRVENQLYKFTTTKNRVKSRMYIYISTTVY